MTGVYLKLVSVAEAKSLHLKKITASFIYVKELFWGQRHGSVVTNRHTALPEFLVQIPAAPTYTRRPA